MLFEGRELQYFINRTDPKTSNPKLSDLTYPRRLRIPIRQRTDGGLDLVRQNMHIGRRHIVELEDRACGVGIIDTLREVK